MNFEEHAAKPLIAKFGLPVPRSKLVGTPMGAEGAAKKIGPCVIKAQVPTGKRGKAGGIKLAANIDEARRNTAAILGMEIDGHMVERVLVEAQTRFTHELYAAVLCDPETKSPVVLFSPKGGMDIEEVVAQNPADLRRAVIDLARGLTDEQAMALVEGFDLAGLEMELAMTLIALYWGFVNLDAELLEINPLVITEDRTIMALDCKLTIDDAAAPRRAEIMASGTPDRLTPLEAEAAAAGLKYIELDGSVGVLANGAGLTMTSMDAIVHFGGKPSNFLEVGGEAYTKAQTALEILLKNPNIKSLLVNFCGAFARTDVMAGGVVAAIKALKPTIPVFFTIHGTGEEEAQALVRRELGIEPYELMDDAVKAAVEAAVEAVA